MNWLDFQDTAKRLARGNTEGDWRSAISRSYYAVFHYFREFLLNNGLDLGQGGQSHFNLYTGLMNCGFPSVAAIAVRIDRLRRSRVRADYELGLSFGQNHALGNTRDADKVLADFQAGLQTLSAKQITDGAKAHLQAIGRLGKTP